MIQTIITKSMANEDLSEKEIRKLYEIPLFSMDFYMILEAARKKSQQSSKGVAEVHAQIGLNIAPCPKNCRFCSFAAQNKVFKKTSELSVEDAIAQAQQFEKDKANAIYVMTTADYPFERFLEISKEIRHALKRNTILVANIGDFSYEDALELKGCGFSGIYHAVRLGEGVDTCIPIQNRLQTMTNAKEAGLTVGTCVEPVGAEHSVTELVEKTIITREIKPVYIGAARRIPIPHTPLARHGIVSEAHMAHVLAVVRLALGSEIQGNCTHEPNVLGAFAGANLLWAEVGSNPRDTVKDTEKKRGMSVSDCTSILKEADWKILQGPSQLFKTV
jgi:biotin synthase